jgi:hypothetical protein
MDVTIFLSEAEQAELKQHIAHKALLRNCALDGPPTIADIIAVRVFDATIAQRELDEARQRYKNG